MHRNGILWRLNKNFLLEPWKRRRSFNIHSNFLRSLFLWLYHVNKCHPCCNFIIKASQTLQLSIRRESWRYLPLANTTSIWWPLDALSPTREILIDESQNQRAPLSLLDKNSRIFFYSKSKIPAIKHESEYPTCLPWKTSLKRHLIHVWSRKNKRNFCQLFVTDIYETTHFSICWLSNYFRINHVNFSFNAICVLVLKLLTRTAIIPQNCSSLSLLTELLSRYTTD